jgi:hypothetical protein
MNSEMTDNNLDMVSSFVFITILFPPLIALFLFNGTYNFYDALDTQEKCVTQKNDSLEIRDQCTTLEDEKDTKEIFIANTDDTALTARWSSYFLVIHPRLFTQAWSKMGSKKKVPNVDENLNLITCTKCTDAQSDENIVESYART